MNVIIVCYMNNSSGWGVGVMGVNYIRMCIIYYVIFCYCEIWSECML